MSGNNNNFNERRATTTWRQNQQSRSIDGPGRQQRKSKIKAPDVSQGEIVSLLENFGFIQSVDRVEDVFFHFSELLDNSNNGESSSHPKVGDFVQFEFRMLREKKEKAARVQILPAGTVLQWDDAFDDEGVVRRGNIINLPSMPTKGSANPTTAQDFLRSCGSIQICNEKGGGISSIDENVYFTFDDSLGRKGSMSCSGRRESLLGTNDLTEFRLVRNRRTKALFARDIVLIQSERERRAEEKEERLLTSSTIERKFHGSSQQASLSIKIFACVTFIFLLFVPSTYF